MSVHNPAEGIIGKWITGDVTVEFFSDGTMKSSSRGSTQTWGYSYSGGSTMKIGIPGRPTTWQSYTIEIAGDLFTLTQPHSDVAVVYTRLE